MEGNNNLPKAITVTLIWDAHALNRDEKVGGNILSIKKLSRNGKTYSFISKTAIRHYLWETLRRAYGWKPAPVRKEGSGDNQTVQFDLTRASIDTHEELDLFGFMYTIKGENSITRKSPIGITKAVAIEDYAGDMAFYANHDLAQRIIANPNPFSKEEHSSFYICTFTIDVEKVGCLEHLVRIKAETFPYTKELKGKNRKEVEERIKSIKLPIDIDNDLKEKFVDVPKAIVSNSKIVKILPDYDKNDKLAEVVMTIKQELDSEKKLQRIRAVLEALHNGLVAQSSGELNTLVPVFFIAAPVKVPVPIFHGRVRAEVRDGKLDIRGIEDALSFSEGWLEKQKPLYIKAVGSCVRDARNLHEKIKNKSKDIKVQGDFEDWLNAIGLNVSNTQSKPAE